MLDIEISELIKKAKIELDKGNKPQSLSILKKAVNEIENDFRIPGDFIVIEAHGGPEYASVCTNEDGEAIVFTTEKDAQDFANAECQYGVVVEI
jgi:hypothetical protein